MNLILAYIYFLSRCRRYVGIARADHWKGPFERVTISSPLFESSVLFNETGADLKLSSHSPFVFIDQNGFFHMLFLLTSGSIVPWSYGQHAWSRDGLSWVWKIETFFSEQNNIDHAMLRSSAGFLLGAKFDDGTVEYFSRRERPL